MILRQVSVLVCLLASVAAGQTVSFASPLDYPSGSLSAVGDISQDGREDVLTDVWGLREIHVANVNGSLAGRVSTLGAGGGSACIADLDGDGKNDVVYLFRAGSGCSASTLRVGMNQGMCNAGVGPELQMTTLGTAGFGCFIGPARVMWDGAGRLWMWETPGTTMWPVDVTFSAIPGGAPTLQEGAPWFANCGVTRAAVLCDLNGDAHADLVMACSTLLTSTDAALHTFLGSAAGFVPNPVGAPVPVPAIPSLEAADLNGDGLDEIVVAHGAAIAVLENLGTSSGGVQQSLSNIWFGPAGQGLPADVDGDGDLDVAILTWSSVLKFLVNDGSGAFALDSNEVQMPSASKVKTGDLDGNGATDIVSTSPNGMVRVHLSTAIPLVEPRPGTQDGVQLHTVTVANGVPAQPVAGPLGSVQRASAGNNVLLSVVAPAFPASPVAIGFEAFTLGCPPPALNSEVWLSLSSETFISWLTTSSAGILDMNITVPPSMPAGFCMMAQAAVISPNALNTLSAVTPAQEIQF
jgi:hypothetical protein